MFDRAPDTPPLLIIKNWYKFNEEKTMCLRENDADAFDCFNAATLWKCYVELSFAMTIASNLNILDLYNYLKLKQLWL